MTFDAYRSYCLAKKGVTESFPFDEKTVVYKVGSKIFTLADIENFVRINVKCDPEKALNLRATYEAVVPAWHMNKKHWNTIYFEGLPQEKLKAWIDHSYDLVVQKLPQKEKASLDLL